MNVHHKLVFFYIGSFVNVNIFYIRQIVQMIYGNNEKKLS